MEYLSFKASDLARGALGPKVVLELLIAAE
jgi:hypothetical protein